MVNYARNYEIEQTLMFYFDGPRSNVSIVNGKIEKVECPPDSKCCIRASRRKSVPEDFVLCLNNPHHEEMIIQFVKFLYSGKEQTSEEWLAWAVSKPQLDQFGQLDFLLMWNMFAPVGATCFEFPGDGYRVAELLQESQYTGEFSFGLFV
jgi:hypothetical protein